MIAGSVSKDFDDYRFLVEALAPELGDRFPVSMQNWCGIGSRPYPLKRWQVYLTRRMDGSRELVGLYSFYQQMEDPEYRFWVGWLGVVPTHRRKGYGTAMLDLVKGEAISLGARELWVHTHMDSRDAMGMYHAYGMKLWGDFKEMGLEQASAEDSSAVLMMTLDI